MSKRTRNLGACCRKEQHGHVLEECRTDFGNGVRWARFRSLRIPHRDWPYGRHAHALRVRGLVASGSGSRIRRHGRVSRFPGRHQSACGGLVGGPEVRSRSRSGRSLVVAPKPVASLRDSQISRSRPRFPKRSFPTSLKLVGRDPDHNPSFASGNHRASHYQFELAYALQQKRPFDPNFHGRVHWRWIIGLKSHRLPAEIGSDANPCREASLPFDLEAHGQLALVSPEGTPVTVDQLACAFHTSIIRRKGARGIVPPVPQKLTFSTSAKS
jgi:hypothetical protein